MSCATNSRRGPGDGTRTWCPGECGCLRALRAASSRGCGATPVVPVPGWQHAEARPAGRSLDYAIRQRPPFRPEPRLRTSVCGLKRGEQRSSGVGGLRIRWWCVFHVKRRCRTAPTRGGIVRQAGFAGRGEPRSGEGCGAWQRVAGCRSSKADPVALTSAHGPRSAVMSSQLSAERTAARCDAR